MVPSGHFWSGGQVRRLYRLERSQSASAADEREGRADRGCRNAATPSAADPRHRLRRIVDGIPAEYLEAPKKHIPEEQWQVFVVQVRGLYKQMARITITPDWAKLLDFETRRPMIDPGETRMISEPYGSKYGPRFGPPQPGEPPRLSERPSS